MALVHCGAAHRQDKEENEREMSKKNDPDERKNVGTKKEGQGNTNPT